MLPTRPCPFCSTTRYLVMPTVSVEVATPLPIPDLSARSWWSISSRVTRFKGTAFVCRGCGHVDYFIADLTGLVDAGATEVDAGPASPFR